MKNLVILLFISIGTLFGQNPTSVENIDNKSKKSYKKTLAYIKSKKYEKALKEINKVVEKNPHFIDGRKKHVQLLLQLKEKTLAIQNLIEIDSIVGSSDKQITLTLADFLEEEGRYALAIEKLRKSLSLNNSKDNKNVKWRIEELEFRKNAYENPLDFQLEPIPINTNHSESLPSFNADGSVMVYTFMEHTTSFRQRQEDLYISYKDKEGNFTPGKKIPNLNTFENEGAQTFSQNGNTIIFTACNRRDSYGGCDLYISFKKNGSWSEAYNMGPTINTRYAEKQPSLSADNKTLYFTSTRKGGKGKEDIWKVHLIGNKWSEAINLGDEINTSENDGSPFIHPDNSTLYFRSEGHIGLGGFDLYISKKKNDNWENPKNLGFPINSKGNDGALFVDLSGEYAYYTTDKGDKEDLDIFKFKLPEKIKPEPVSYAKFVIKDAESLEPIKASIYLKKVSSEAINSLQTNLNGTALSVIAGGEYIVTVKKDEYIFYSEHISVPTNGSKLNPYLIEIPLLKMPIESETSKIEKPIVLKNIFFETGSSDLLDESDMEIEALYELLIKNPNSKIKIIGHTDNVGDDHNNLKLSEERAKTVRNELVQKGIDANRLQFEGKGENKPIAENSTPEGRQKNRRTEFVFIK